MQVGENRIKFKLGNMKLVSKVIDGKFPDYNKVVPTKNEKSLVVSSKDFINSIERVASVSLDRKEGVKVTFEKDHIQLFVASSSSGDGKETLMIKFDYDLEISFNSRYLIDVASQIDGEKIELFFNDSGSPVLIKDPGDFDSIYVVMPMKG